MASQRPQGVAAVPHTQSRYSPPLAGRYLQVYNQSASLDDTPQKPDHPQEPTMLTDVQKQKFAHQFRVFDADRNGQLEWTDYERVCNNIADTRGYKPGSPEYEALMGQYRYGWEQAAPFAEGNALSLQKWLEYSDAILSTPGIYDTLVRPTAGMIFDTFDLDGDQKVSIDEWREFFRCYSIDPSEADKCFDRYDLNGDGYVSRSELIDLVGQFFLSSDPDAAGNLLFGTYAG
jgi:Ca2+-binding EF-hand superfamily protein